MILAVDIGNTNIAMGFVENETVLGTFRLTTKTPRTSDEYVIALASFFQTAEIQKQQVNDVIISSVVPQIMYAFNSAIIKFLKKEPIIIGPGIKTGVKIHTENPKEVGADRIVDVVAGYHKYHSSCIVVDFGTATTFDYISKDAEFKYCIIAPGIGISASALTSQAAKLPNIEIQKPESILGTNTIQGMQAGVVYGYIGAVEYIIKTMKKELNDPNCKVIATGGLGKLITSETDYIHDYDPDLAYKGMWHIYTLNKGE